MNDIARDRIKHAANVEVIRRSLISYFVQKGFTESFEKVVNPISIQDISIINTGLHNKIEIEPHAVEIDPSSSRAILGWNMYVLGNQRMYLGETHHNNLTELARQLKQGMVMPESILMTRRCTTPRRIITFIERTLGDHEAGCVDLTPLNRPVANSPRSIQSFGGAGSQSAQFYTRSS